MEPQYVIGIDLGTTNSSLSYSRIESGSGSSPSPPVELLPIPQLANPGEVREPNLLPSFLYIPGTSDFPSGSLALPWDADPSEVVGQLAQKRGVENAGRLVSSAKSWLSHAGVDRTAPLLPFRAPEGVPRISPVEASRRYLEHLRSGWNHRFPDAPMEQQHLLVTVPASFDEVARELTATAAEQAGYRNVTLLEEPQAAFYAWIERHPDWRDRVQLGDLILVVDIGGGTTDFTLIAVKEHAGELALERIAVGEHILLGGDNMDLALARTIEAELAGKSVKLDALQLHALWHNCRVAKEKLLDPAAKSQKEPVTILGKGTGLVGGTIKASLTREHIHTVLEEGFFPSTGSTEMPQAKRRTAVQEIGLPYAADPAVTRHLARFLRRGGGEFLGPTHVLFNGGVLNADLVRDRILSVLNRWLEEEGKPAIQALTGEDLMHAVSRGAVYYGSARRGRGVRIRGGVPRTYYVGIESAMPAIPGMPAPLKALTVVPFGLEEGSEVGIPGQEFGLVVGEPAEFRFFSSTTRRDDAPGELLEEIDDRLEEITPMEVNLKSAEDKEGGVVPVAFQAKVTETGVLQLWCVARDGRRWKLEFNVRERVTQ
ncbi:MAG: Hsp70 family protein [Bryobacteraceae bacterium]